MSVGSNVVIEDALSVKDNVTLSSSLSVGNNVVIEDALSVKENVTLSSSLSVGSNVVIENMLSVKDNVSFGKSLIVNDNITVNDSIFLHNILSVNDKVYFDRDAYVNNTLYVGNDVNMMSHLSIKKNIYCSNMFVNDTLEARSNLTVYGSVNLMSNLEVRENLNVQESLETNNLNVRTNLSVGNIETYILSIKNDARISNDVFIGGNLSVHNIYQSGSVTAISTTSTQDNFTVNGELSVSNASKFGDDVIINSNLYVYGNVLKIPFGTIDSKPNRLTAPVGSIYFNSNLGRVEVFNNEREWAALGSLENLSKDTFVETSYNGDTSILAFYAKDGTFPKVTLGNTLSVSIDSYFDGQASFHKEVIMYSNLVVYDSIKTHSHLSIASGIYVNENIIDDTIVFLKPLVTVSGEIIAESNIYIKEKALVFNGLSIGGPVFVENDLYVDSNLSVGGFLDVTNDVKLHNNLSIQGSIECDSNLYVKSHVHLSSNMIINEALSIGGNITCEKSIIIDDNLIVDKTIYTSNIYAFGSLSTLEDLSSKTINIHSNLSIGTNAYIHGSLLVNDTVNLKEEVIFDSNVYVHKAIEVENIDIQADCIVHKDYYVHSNAYIGKKLSIGEDVNISGNLHIQDIIHAYSNVYIEGVTQINRNLNIQDSVVINNTLSVGNSVYIEGDDTNISGELSVYGNVDANSITCQHTSSFGENLIVTGILSVGQLYNVGAEIRIETQFAQENFAIDGELSVSKNVYLKKDVEISSNLMIHGNMLKIPYGTNMQRPNRYYAPIGCIYFNSNMGRVEVLNNDNEWIGLGSVIDTDGDTFISAEFEKNDNTLSFFTGNNHIPKMILNENILSIDTPTIVNTYIKSHDIYTSNITTKYIDVDHLEVQSNINVGGNYKVNGNLQVDGDLIIHDTTFPLLPTTNDASKVLGVNENNGYELLSLFHPRNTCEFKSLFGEFETGLELNHVSGMFDFGVPQYWMSGWRGRLFDGVIQDASILSMDEDSIDMSTIDLLEDLSTSNMDFKDFISINMYKTNGERLKDISGIAVHDNVNPQYYFFLGTIDPNHQFFKYKFKRDFDSFYSSIPGLVYGNNYGYSVYLDSIRIPHKELHPQGTNLFVVEFINTYDNTSSTLDLDYKFRIPDTEILRKFNYFVTLSNDDHDIHQVMKSENIGLYPHITYRTWRNSLKTWFYENKYDENIKWGVEPNINDIFERHHNNSNLFELYKLTYKYIKHGKTNEEALLSEIEFEQLYQNNVINILPHHNLIIHSNMNSNMNFIKGNINAVSFSPDAFQI